MTVTTDPRTLARDFIASRGLLSAIHNLPTDGSIATRDPYSGDIIVDVPSVAAAAVDVAIARAKAAQATWKRVTPAERATYLVRLASLIDEHYDEIAAIESLDAGKLYAGTRGWDVSNARDVLRFYADSGSAYLGQSESYDRASSLRQPVGVVAILAPWNAPLAVGVWKLAPALLAGCAVVVKAPERAPMSTLALAHLAAEAGLPKGLVNVVTGDGRIGNALVSHPDVAAVSFTGGTAIASAIVAASAENVPRLLLELGGKNANVVFADADLDEAAAGTVTAMFDVAGQNCCAGSRTLVEQSVYDEFVARSRTFWSVDCRGSV